MAGAVREQERAPEAGTGRPDDRDRYDPLRIAVRAARDAFDPERARLERRAPTAPLIWYIEDMPDLALPRPDGAAEIPARRPDTGVPLADFDTAAGIV